MHSHRRPRGRTAFEVLCALSLGASFAAAGVQLGAPALLASAGLAIMFGLYWASGLFARDAAVRDIQPAPAVAADPLPVEARVAEPEPAVAEPVALDPAPAKKPRKARARKAGKEPEAPPVEPPMLHDERPIEQLFDPQPFVRQQRPAFGRRDRRPLPFAPTA